MSEPRFTPDGLPVITEETFREIFNSYPFRSSHGDPNVRNRIKNENPELYRVLEIVANAAPTFQCYSYYMSGIEIAYELLRTQSAENKKK